MFCKMSFYIPLSANKIFFKITLIPGYMYYEHTEIDRCYEFSFLSELFPYDDLC